MKNDLFRDISATLHCAMEILKKILKVDIKLQFEQDNQSTAETQYLWSNKNLPPGVASNFECRRGKPDGRNLPLRLRTRATHLSNACADPVKSPQSKEITFTGQTTRSKQIQNATRGIHFAQAKQAYSRRERVFLLPVAFLPPPTKMKGGQWEDEIFNQRKNKTKTKKPTLQHDFWV